MPPRQQPHKGLTHDNWSNSCPRIQETSKWPMPWHDSSWIWAFSQKLLCGGMYRLPVCQEGLRGSSWVYRKRSGQEVARVNLQVPPKRLESIYFLEPGRGREENAWRSVQELGKIKQTELSLGEVCPVDRKCFFEIVLKVSLSASAPEARDKKPDYF